MVTQTAHEHKKRPSNTIELRIEEIAQLFDELDPYPFRERDLDSDAETYIVGWARELPRRIPIKIVVHLPRDEAATRQGILLGDTMTRYFTNRAEVARSDLKELFRIGRRSLAIGICVLAVCLFLGQFVVSHLGPSYIARFIQESLFLLGWVANWRPMDIMLYDWLPISRSINLYKRLANAEVTLRPYDEEPRPPLILATS